MAIRGHKVPPDGHRYYMWYLCDFLTAGQTAYKGNYQKRHDGDQQDKNGNTFHGMEFTVPITALSPPVDHQNMDIITPETRCCLFFFKGQ